MNQFRRKTNGLNVISVTVSLPSGPCSVTVRLHVTGIHSSMAFSPRLTWRRSSFQRVPEQGIRPHEWLGNSFIQQLAELNLFVTLGRLGVSHNDLPCRLLLVRSALVLPATRRAAYVYSYFFPLALGRFTYSR